MIGWAIGGVFFGILGDRIGRAKTMMHDDPALHLFTGLSVFATGIWDFNVYRFLCGLGVGGQFAVGVALVAEVVPDAGAAVRAGAGAGALGGRQHDGGDDRNRARARWSSAGIDREAPGAGCSWPARCPPRWRCWSSRN